jgi:hypothetical protein
MRQSLYTGEIRHEGQIYPGEHTGILAPGAWERVQTLITHPASVRGRGRNKHLALLSGLLYCECCAAPMVYSYTGKKERRYPYYVCLNAQRRGRAVCPAKSLSARSIEDSILGWIREAQRGLFAPGEWEHLERIRQVQAVHEIVARIGYEGTTRQITIRFRAAAPRAGGGTLRERPRGCHV